MIRPEPSCIDLPTKSVAIVTGSSGGLGRAIARLCAQRGIRVIATGRNVQELERLSNIPNIETFCLDLLSTHSVHDLLAVVPGRLDLVVNCAGAGYFGTPDDLSAAQRDAIYALNVEIPIKLIEAATPLLARSGGAVLNIASVLAFARPSAMACLADSKAALLEWTQTWRSELAVHGVKMYSFCPGLTATGFLGTCGAQATALGRFLFMTKPEVAAARAIDMLSGTRDVGFSCKLDRIIAVLAPRLPQWGVDSIIGFLLRPIQKRRRPGTGRSAAERRRR